MIGRKLITSATIGVAALLVCSQLFAQADVIQKRQKLMKSNSAAAKAIKAAVEKKDFAAVEVKAKDILGNADKIVAAFPKGSTVGKTKAKPEIWENPADFAKHAKNLANAAGELADAAKAGDDAAVTAKVKTLGNACASCHKAYRAQKYSE
jgi:cytochrome c556